MTTNVRLGLLPLLIALAFLAADCEAVGARELRYEHIDVEMVFNPDTSINVTETQTVRLDVDVEQDDEKGNRTRAYALRTKFYSRIAPSHLASEG